MPVKWVSLPCFLLFSVVSSFASSPSFENTAIVRTVELGGSVVHVTTTYAIKALKDEAKIFTVALAPQERDKTSWLEAKVKGQQKPLVIQERTEEDLHYVDIVLPKPLGVDNTLNLVFETVQTHATRPWPETASQNDEQALKYMTDLFVLSPYSTLVQRTKLRSLSPRIISYTTPKDIESFTDEAPVTKSGATVVYGPYKDIPASNTESFISKHQQPVTVHYYHDQPVLEVLSLKRSVEISHWGANLNTQDEIFLHNAGPKLKGHFSRLEHQVQAYMKRPVSHMLPALILYLPAGIRSSYFYDLNGNVSTSRLRSAPSAPKGSQRTQYSVLEFKPRYPIFGGWNYSFTLGWDTPLEDSTSYDKATGTYTVAVPILTPITGAVVNDEELKIVLPEGATDVEFITPFPPLSSSIDTHVTYLDTIGRPCLTFRYKDMTVKHAQDIYVSYKVSATAHIRKALAVAAVFFSVFTFAMFARRVNLRIDGKSKAQ